MTTDPATARTVPGRARAVPAAVSERTMRVLGRAAVALFVAFGAAFSDSTVPVVVTATALGLLAVALLPGSGWPALGGAVVATAAVAALCDGSSSNVGWFAICALAGWCALRGGPRLAAAYGVVGAAVFAVEAGRNGDAGWATWVIGTGFTVAVCLLARRQQELLDQLRQAQAGLTERVRLEERNRVARELHDVIAHSLTVSLLHVSSARLAVEDDPAQAAEALAQAEQLGRQSLTEVRHAVGLLREGTGERAPLPGADSLPALVDGFRRAGAQVAYEVDGDPATLPATTGLTVYRILQESLTNAVRHGAGQRAAVRLRVRDCSTELTVDNDGAAGPPRRDGVGLQSMRERAEALGGELSAGPSAAGWRVHAVLPS